MKRASENFFKRLMLGSAFTPIIFLFIIGLSSSLWLWQTANADIKKELDTVYQQGYAGVEDLLNKRVSSYEQLLLGGTGLLAANNNNVDSTQWSTYIRNLDVKTRNPGLISSGYVKYIRPSDLAAHIQAVRNQTGDQNYNVYPAGERTDYTAVQYYEPRTGQTRSIVGFDMSTDPIRQAAMEKARDSGQVAMTDALTFVNDTKVGKPGFILFQPVYISQDPATTELRQQALNGYVFASVRIEDIFSGLFNAQTQDKSALFVYQGDSTKDEDLIYKSPNSDEFVKRSKLLVRSSVIHIKDHTWTLKSYATNDLLLTNSKRGQPLLLLIVGVLSTMLLCIFLIFVLRTRSRELAYVKQLEVQSAKDELLSLASHQLRTPATGVKQYLGMVLQGYAGRITAKQREMLDKAQTSNERQLEIVNQILYVTKLESGTVNLSATKVDLRSMIKDVIEEQGDAIRAHKHKIIFKPKSPVYMQGNEQYLRMVFENLVSNAVKYMEHKGRIIIEVRCLKYAVVVRVSDDGVGIGEHDIPKLFQKFSRIDNELSVQAGGSGIGLYIVKMIVTLHGGTIEVASEESVGTTFQVTFPRPG